MSIIDDLFDTRVRETTTTMSQQINQIQRRIEVLDDRIATIQARTQALGAGMVATLSYSTDSWITNHNETVLRPLMAEICHAFVQKAISLLEKTHPSLIPARITDDKSRIPLFAAFVQSIPTEIYEAWGLPGYQKIMEDQFMKYASFTKPIYFQYDYHDMAEILSSTALHPRHRQARDVLEPIFMFVHGKSFAEMRAQGRVRFPGHCSSWHGYRKLPMQWSPKSRKQTWREPGKRGTRSGGRRPK